MAVIEMQTNGLPKVIEQDADEGNVVDLSKVEITPLGPPQRSTAAVIRDVQKAYEAHRNDSSAPLTAAQMKRDIRARLKVVRREIALRRKLEREEQQLVRLLKAVSEKPRPVSSIRATG